MSMTKDLGFALVGCGAIGERNAESVADAHGAHLVRVVDTDLRAARACGERFNVPTSPSLHDALDDPAVDGVFIATPHDLHARMMIEAAKASKHVLVEKPLATTIADAQSAIAACEKYKVNLSVCHPPRYEEKIRFAQRFVRDGYVGRLLLTSSLFLKEKTADYWEKTPWRSSRERSGGGVVIMNLMHHFDAIQAVTGCRITSAIGLNAAQVQKVEVEDTAVVALRYETGALGSIAACSSLPGPKVFEDSIYGQNGRVVIEKRSVRAMTRLPRSHTSPWAWTSQDFEEDRISKRCFVEGFVSSVIENTPPPVPATYGLALLELVLQFYQAGEVNTEIRSKKLASGG
jgi:predicted dehydrogenase